MNALDVISIIILIGFGLFILGVGGYYVWVFIKYNKYVTIKVLANGNKKRITDRARFYKDKQNVYWWKLRKTKTALNKLLPLPPTEAIELNKKGKECATLYLSDTGQVVYQNDVTISLDKVNVEPMTTKHRSLYAQALEQANSRVRKSWTDHIAPIAIGGTLVIVVLILVLGYGEFVKPIKELEGIRTAQLEIQSDMLDKIENIDKDVQVIHNEMGVETTDPPPN